MKIAIEAQRIFRPNKHGMDFVALETIRELQKRNDGNQYYVIVAPGEDRCLENSANLSIIEVKYPTYPLWEQIGLPQEMGWFYRRLVVPHIIKKCKKIITVSHFECNCIQQALKIPVDQITTVYNGYSAHFRIQKETDMAIVQKYIPEKDFLFFLGNTDPKKNAARTLKAYSIYLQQSIKKRPLLIADLKEEYIDNLLQLEGITNIKSYLYYPGYISNQDLAILYNAAFAFLYPSLRESFGIPIIEAMASGTPVITGNISAMPEVAGSGALTIDPYKPEEIANALLALETDNNLYKQQQNYGLERARQFSWEKTACELINIYKEILS